MTLADTDGRPVGLRKEPVDHVLELVEERLGTAPDRGRLVCKRRTVGAPTDRSTWVRIERRLWSRAREQGWAGAETAAVLTGVVMLRWTGSVAWPEPGDGAIWRADETSFLPGAPVGTAILAAEPGLPDNWFVVHTAAVSGPKTSKCGICRAGPAARS
ncbi:hypothetical protein ACI1MP_01160 [Kitasatospora griseola]|uniref:hypothetical protein n=1 Tax=Kitasatospora griseola TaxID=2064 RepID=UPI0038557811